MTCVRATRTRLLLCAATGILLLACSVAAWVLPRPLMGADPRTAPSAPAAAASSRAGDDPCALILGAARDYCTAPAVENTEPVAAAASSNPGEQAPWLLLFSTAAIAAGIGLAITVGRPSR